MNGSNLETELRNSTMKWSFPATKNRRVDPKDEVHSERIDPRNRAFHFSGVDPFLMRIYFAHIFGVPRVCVFEIQARRADDWLLT